MRREAVAVVALLLLTVLGVGIAVDFGTDTCEDTLAACAPQAIFEMTAENGTLTVEHGGGESFSTDDSETLTLELRRDRSTVDEVTWLGPDGVSEDGNVTTQDTLVVAAAGANSGTAADARLNASLEPGDELRLVWRDGEQSATLAVFVIQSDGSVARPQEGER